MHISLGGRIKFVQDEPLVLQRLSRVREESLPEHVLRLVESILLFRSE